MKLLHNDADISFLAKQFPDIEFSLFRSDDPANFISCFVARFSNSDKCEKTWLDITSLIALEYQETLHDESAEWNIYLVILCHESMKKSLKYQIENDRFSLRKMVLDGTQYVNINKEQVIVELENIILGNDLKILRPTSAILESPDKLEGNIIRDILKGGSLPVDGKEASIQVRKLVMLELLAVGE